MKIAFQPTDILLPHQQNMKKWSVVACDQYTGQPEYWKQVEELVGQAPSTLHMILPEIYLESEDVESRIDAAHKAMHQYLEENVFKKYKNALIYTERTQSDGLVRKGLIGALDLEEYDFSPDSTTLCRATEQTVTSRIPPRQKVRQTAALELPHVLVLIDDKQGSVIEALNDRKHDMKKVYDFSLMQQGGSLRGYVVDEQSAAQALKALEHLCTQSEQKYGSALLYLVGDGNHSLATAKACYESVKARLGEKAKEHPSRYALVELNNLQSDGIVFEPIHRVLYNVDAADLLEKLHRAHPQQHDAAQQCIVYQNTGEQILKFTNPTAKLTVGTLQKFLDEYLAIHPEVKIDYIHEEGAVKECCQAEKTVGFLLPAIEKDAFFESIVKDGVLPRKTFSMGNACDKRFYLECRYIGD